MPKKPTRKELLREPEVVRTLQQKVQDWVLANQKTAAIGAAALFLAIALVVGVRQWGAYQEARAMELYGQAKVELAADGTVRPESAAQALKELAKVSAAYPKSRAARFAELERANILYSQGKFQEAAAAYSAHLARFKEGDEFALLAKQGLAYSKLGAGDLAGAAQLFQELEGQGFGAGSAQLQLGLIYELQGKLPQALEAYQQAANEARGPEAALANARLEALLPPKAGGV